MLEKKADAGKAYCINVCFLWKYVYASILNRKADKKNYLIRIVMEHSKGRLLTISLLPVKDIVIRKDGFRYHSKRFKKSSLRRAATSICVPSSITTYPPLPLMYFFT
jgi:hypothetical protein